MLRSSIDVCPIAGQEVDKEFVSKVYAYDYGAVEKYLDPEHYILSEEAIKAGYLAAIMNGYQEVADLIKTRREDCITIYEALQANILHGLQHMNDLTMQYVSIEQKLHTLKYHSQEYIDETEQSPSQDIMNELNKPLRKK